MRVHDRVFVARDTTGLSGQDINRRPARMQLKKGDVYTAFFSNPYSTSGPVNLVKLGMHPRTAVTLSQEDVRKAFAEKRV